MKKKTRRQPPGPRISACLIARDEEVHIVRALRSLRTAVDQVVVVDTGSTDRTPELAEREGAEVIHFPWTEDFAAARNESLRHASGDWILYIDADEELVERRPGALRRLCAQLRASQAGALLTIHNPVDAEGASEVTGEQWRLFRNQRGVHFEGRVHEQLRWPDGAPALHAAADAVTIQHWGYIPNQGLIERKGERNRRLLALSLAEQPDEPGHHFHLGRQYAWERDFAQALQPLRRAIELWTAHGRPADGYVPSMFATAGLAALRLQQPREVLAIAAASPAEHVSAELLFVAGVAHANLGETEQAIYSLNRAWQDHTLARATGSDPSTATWRPLLALAEIYVALGRAPEARQALDQALAFAPDRQDLRQARQRLAKAEPLVSVCMIVRDEEANLRRWLPLAVAAADEVVVVDTGSRDNTMAVARELGARVYQRSWDDDFAAARNESLRHATGRWILWHDADDELVEASPGALRRLCRALPDTAMGCWLPVQSALTIEGDPGASMRQWRLFRNGLGIRFRGRIHEQPIGDGVSTDQLLYQEDVQVRHWGYTSPAVMGAKLERNRRLLRMSIADEPDEPFHYYSLGKQENWEHDFSAAAEYLEKARSLWLEHGAAAYGYVAPLFAVTACTNLNLGRPEQALATEAACPPSAMSSDLLYYAAIACQRVGDLSGAVARLERAIADPTVRNASETDPATATWRPRLLLAQLFAQQNRPKDAYRVAIEAIDLMPDKPDVLLGGAAMAQKRGETADAERICRRILASQADDGTKARAAQILRELEAPAVPA